MDDYHMRGDLKQILRVIKEEECLDDSQLDALKNRLVYDCGEADMRFCKNKRYDNIEGR